MTARRLSSPGEEYFRVRVVFPGGVLHLAAPQVPLISRTDDGGIEVHADWLTNPDLGDTVGFIDWNAVTALTWRWTGQGPWHTFPNSGETPR